MKLKVLFISMLVLISTILFGCASKIIRSDNSYKEINSKELSTYVASVTSTQDKTRTYNSIEELIKYSDTIFDGDIQSVSYFDKGNYTYSKLTVSVTDSYYGDTKIGDVVTIIEPGGVTTLANYQKIVGEKKFSNITDKDFENQYIKIIYNGTELSKANDKVLFFACKDKKNYWNLPSDYYFIVGYKDGKFNINDTVKRNSNDLSISPLNMSKENYKKIIKEKIGKK